MPSDHLDHIAVVAPDIEPLLPAFAALTGAEPTPIREVAELGLRVAFVGPVELLQPLGDVGPVAEHLVAHGTSLHHIALRVPDLDAAMAEHMAAGGRLAEAGPRTALDGRRLIFLHPATTGGVLTELVEGP